MSDSKSHPEEWLFLVGVEANSQEEAKERLLSGEAIEMVNVILRNESEDYKNA